MYILCWRYAREHYLYTKYGGYAVVEIKLGYKEVEDAVPAFEEVTFFPSLNQGLCLYHLYS